MKAPTLGEAAIDLPWLAPCAGSLISLTRPVPGGVWEQVRFDPGCVLLLIRHGPTLPEALQNPAVLDSAHPLLAGPGYIDWQDFTLFPIYQASVRQAFLARELARQVNECDPDLAWAGGMLASLGWLAAAAVEPAQVEACRQHRLFVKSPTEAQHHCWGLDHTAIARRLARRWNLPPWLATIIGHLGLPAGIAQSLGAEPKLFQVVQLAVGLVNQQGWGLNLTVGTPPAELADTLGLTKDSVDKAIADTEALAVPDLETWEAPSQNAMLPELLRLATEQRKRSEHVLVERLQTDVDQLQRALEIHCTGEKDRLQTLKLSALAELAAGAGHEINNPLAVISGQAQYLLHHENDPDRRKSLQTIVGQAHRIHQILLDLMQFAKPSAPQKQPVEINSLVQLVAESLQEYAVHRQVRLQTPLIAPPFSAEPKATLPPTNGVASGSALNGDGVHPPRVDEPRAAVSRDDVHPPIMEVHADPAQVRIIVTALLRNAIEAAPPEGWAGIRLHLAGPQGVEIVIEDSGPGPTLAAQEHLFDPFFSGRSAGRGRGLGLATAWRLARQNNAEVRFAGHTDGVTRFVLHFPLARLRAPVAETNGHHAPLNGTHLKLGRPEENSLLPKTSL